MKVLTSAAVVLFLLAGQVFGAERTFTLVAAENTVDTVTSEVIVREAYRRLGYKLEIRKFPGERALKLANSGAVDGDVQRIDGLSKKYENLIQIRPAINFIEGAVFSAGDAYNIDGWSSLRPHKLGIIRGIKFAENNTQGMDTTTVGNYENLFRMLENGRIDLAVSPSLNGRFQSKILGIGSVVEQKPAVARFDLFHYIHKNNADLAPKLGAVFAEMKQAGDLARVRSHVISVLLGRAERGLGPCDDYRCFEDALDFQSE